TVSAQGSLSLAASADLKIVPTAGAAGVGIGGGGVGAANSTYVANDTTLAFIGSGAHITALGKDSVKPVYALSGRNGNVVNNTMHGLSLTAVSSLTLLTIAAGAAGGGALGIAGTATVCVVTDKTLAYVDQLTTINANNSGAGTAQDINL